MDVKLQNAYAKVVLDNFMEVVKQNLLFQSQLEVMKSSLVDSEALQKQIQELTETNRQIKTNVNAQNNSLSQEQKRLQAAVNEYMKANKILEEELTGVKNELAERNKYIKKLEKQKAGKKEEVILESEVQEVPEIPAEVVENPTISPPINTF